MNEEEEKLEKEQEQVLLKLSQVLPESSQETIFSDEERKNMKLRDEGRRKTSDSTCKENEPCTRQKRRKRGIGYNSSYTKKARPRKIHMMNKKMSAERRRKGTNASSKEESRDSGFATSSEQFFKADTPKGIRGRQSSLCSNKKGSDDLDLLSHPPLSDLSSNRFNGSQESLASLESVSLLQAEGDSVKENKFEAVTLAWNLKIFPSVVDDDEEMDIDYVERPQLTADKSVQTESILCLPEMDEKMKRNIGFLCSVIKLKNIFSSKRYMSTKNCVDILKELQPPISCRESPRALSSEPWNEPVEMEAEGIYCERNFTVGNSDVGGSSETVERREQNILTRKMTVSHDTAHYVMRTASAEEVAEKSVDSILVWLKEEMRRDLPDMFNHWSGSVWAVAAETVNEAVDSSIVDVRKKTFDFLVEVLDEICDCRSSLQDSTLEHKTSFLSKFCKSFFLLYDVIIHVEGKLDRLKDVKKLYGSNKLKMIASVKRNYFILRLLEELLTAFLRCLKADGLGFICKRPPKDTNPDILEIWKKSWKTEKEVCVDSSRDHHLRYLSVVNGWCNRTDDILAFCTKEMPLLSLVTQKCSLLAREIASTVQSLFSLS